VRKSGACKKKPGPKKGSRKKKEEFSIQDGDSARLNAVFRDSDSARLRAVFQDDDSISDGDPARLDDFFSNTNIQDDSDSSDDSDSDIQFQNQGEYWDQQKD